MTDPSHIAEIERAMKWCRDYLGTSADAKTLEPFFVRLFIIDAISSYEKTIYDVVAQRAKHSCDPEFARYVEKTMEMRGRPFGATWRFLLSAHTDLYRDEFENSLYRMSLPLGSDSERHFGQIKPDPDETGLKRSYMTQHNMIYKHRPTVAHTVVRQIPGCPV